jgi:hypothetical protein
MKQNWKLMVPTALVALTVVALASADGIQRGFADWWGALYRADQVLVQTAAQRPPPPAEGRLEDRARHWNKIAVDASGLDHTPVAPGEARVFGEQFGPLRSSRAMAIVHIAVFDAVNAIAGGYRSYTGLHRALEDTSMDAAIAVAAHDTLVALFPSQAARVDGLMTEDLHQIREGRAKANGILLGRQAAATILARRAHDGSQFPEPRIGIEFITSDDPGKWRQDPISHAPLALGAYWNRVGPFVLTSAARFRVPPPHCPDQRGIYRRVQRSEAPGR